MSKLVFVIGAGRSGSTLFMNMMNEHSSIIAPPEHDFLLNSLHKFGRKEFLSDKEITTWVRDLWIRKTEFREIWQLNEKELLTDLLKGNKSYVNVFKTIIAAYDTSKKDASILIDKNPFYTAHVDLLKSRFPDAVFICLVRDFRDRYVSILRNESEVFKNDVARTAIWNSYNLEIKKLKDESPEIAHVLKFEDLVSDPVKALGEVCDFLKVNFETEMLDYHKVKRMKFSAAGVLNDAVNKMHEGSNKPVNSAKVGLWKSKLDSDELKRISFFCNETAEEFGYTDLVELTDKEMKSIKKKYGFELKKGQIRLFLKKMSYRLPWWLQKGLAKYYRKSLANKDA